MRSLCPRIMALFFMTLMAIACGRDRPLPAPDPEVRISKKHAALMGTIVEVSVAAAPNRDPSGAMDQALAEAARVERLMSEYRSGSDVSRINAAAGLRPVKVAPEVFRVIEKAVEASRLTSGAFDVTFAALKGVWDFKAENPRPPSEEAIHGKLGLIDYRKVVLDASAGTVFLPTAGMAVGLGGIAKGYAADRASLVLKRAGFPDHIVNAGGDLAVRGRKGKTPWKAGVRHPRDLSRMLAKIRVARDGAIVTSGDYEKFFEYEGQRYHHILDPNTGRPARGLASVTVLAPDSLLADALATGIFVLGPEQGLALAERLPDVEAILVDENLNLRMTRGLDRAATIDAILLP